MFCVFLILTVLRSPRFDQFGHSVSLVNPPPMCVYLFTHNNLQGHPKFRVWPVIYDDEVIS